MPSPTPRKGHRDEPHRARRRSPAAREYESLAAHQRATHAATAKDLVLIDREGRYGGSPVTLFKPLLRALQRAMVAGDNRVVLSGAKLNVVVLALQKAIWVEEEVLPRDLYAFSALNDRMRSPDQRLRLVAQRLLARPDRPREGRAASFPTRRILAEYRALTGQGAGDTSAYISRSLSGLTQVDHAFEQLQVPLSRADAVQAIRAFHGFPSRRAASAFIRRAILALPEAQRPHLPALR